jgi:hypothetical protein
MMTIIKFFVCPAFNVVIHFAKNGIEIIAGFHLDMADKVRRNTYWFLAAYNAFLALPTSCLKFNSV